MGFHGKGRQPEPLRYAGGRGIGSRLMEEIESRLHSKGCLRCYLMVTTDNPEGMQYHEKHGWERMDYVVTYAKNLI